jgi:hypothetical protein
VATLPGKKIAFFVPVFKFLCKYAVRICKCTTVHKGRRRTFANKSLTVRHLGNRTHTEIIGKHCSDVVQTYVTITTVNSPRIIRELKSENSTVVEREIVLTSYTVPRHSATSTAKLNT